MRFILRAIIAAVTITGPVACARYEWVPDYDTPACKNYHPPGSTGTLTTEQDSTAVSGSLHGRVVAANSRGSVPGTSVTLLMDSPRTTTTDSAGTFAFTDVPGGTYILRTRRIGYKSRTDTLHVAQKGGASFVLPLDTQELDGPCSGFAALRVRKPWWKLWARSRP